MDNRVSFGDILQYANSRAKGESVLIYETNSSLIDPDYLPICVDAFMVMICVSGRCRVGIDLDEYDVEEGCMIVLQPQMYLTKVVADDDYRVVVMVCSRDELDEMLPEVNDLLTWLMFYRMEPVERLSEDAKEKLLRYYRFIGESLLGRKTPFQGRKVRRLFEAMLYELLEIDEVVSKGESYRRSRKKEIMARFLTELSENFKDTRQVGDYAEMLYMTPKHLSTVVKQVSGRTAGEWIEDMVVMEAKVLLRTTDLSIQEISQRLNFVNQSFFGKYFKHVAGVSPSDYRKENICKG